MIRIHTAAVATGALLLMLAADLFADDWVRRTFNVEGVKDGLLTFEYPLSWGKKPKYKTFDNVTDITFGPYGPRAKPVFLLQMQLVPTIDPVNADQLNQIAEAEVGAFSDVAFESDISINALQGEHSSIRYFSITDKEKRWGEFDYLTMAVVASGALLTKVYFFSSDGAPDFGADAVRMLESIKYTPPVVKEDAK